MDAKDGGSELESSKLLYRRRVVLSVADVERFRFQLRPTDATSFLNQNVHFLVKNCENVILTPAFLNGPFVVYVDVRPGGYCGQRIYSSNDKPKYEPNLSPGQTFQHNLLIDRIKDEWVWEMDIISQIIFSSKASIEVEVCFGIGDISQWNFNDNVNEGNFSKSGELRVDHQNTLDLWNLAPRLLPGDDSKPKNITEQRSAENCSNNEQQSLKSDHNREVEERRSRSTQALPHIVILTHGLHSNTYADMSFMRDQLLKKNDQLIVRGFNKNVCKTERGVKYLGKRLARWLVNECRSIVQDLGLEIDEQFFVPLTNALMTKEEKKANKPTRSSTVTTGSEGKRTSSDPPVYTKISFIGHSLGGLVQSYAIKLVNRDYPHFFHMFQPENFITMAAPLLGISNENPKYVKMFLALGLVGKSGEDLNLRKKSLLMQLPDKPMRALLRKFKKRSLYANVVNDGIVPLRTSALLFLDWKGLSEVYQAQEHPTKPEDDEDNDMKSSNGEHVGKIPENFSDGIINDSINNLKTKVQSILSLCLPQLNDGKMTHKYQKYQVNIGGTGDDDSAVDEDNGNGGDDDEGFLSIPKSNVIKSIKSVILPPLPSEEFIMDPNSRTNCIIHDKLYHNADIPPPNASKRMHHEEELARKWHKGLSWNKTLVVLKPDSHNNIIVRRRFSNAYGWQVIDHMVENNFSNSSDDNRRKKSTDESLFSDNELDSDCGESSECESVASNLTSTAASTTNLTNILGGYI